MEKVLISACLAGERVRYNGEALKPVHEKLVQLVEKGLAVLFCPEVAAGLCVPRDPAEIVGEGGGDGVLRGKAKVMSCTSEDVSGWFVAGARLALELCQKEGIARAILKERSPSCGASAIYGGDFSGTLIEGEGVATSLLRRHGIQVLSEAALDEI